MSAARRVLVVDDEPLIASMIADWLQELGYDVAGTASTAEDALAVAQKAPISAALLDVTLGEGDSFALAEDLVRRGVGVAFITGRDADSLPPAFKSSPILGKPFDFEAMRTMLEALIASSGAAGDA